MFLQEISVLSLPLFKMLLVMFQIIKNIRKFCFREKIVKLFATVVFDLSSENILEPLNSILIILNLEYSFFFSLLMDVKQSLPSIIHDHFQSN